jgi:hypothetical protein
MEKMRLHGKEKKNYE